MSLWYKPIAEISFDDVKAFCEQRVREGPRLDYKAEFPKHLERLVAAFANTLGGLILIGIEADKTTNEPNWPPKGLPTATGIEERIIAICRDSIYPPVRPEISPVLENPHAPGTVVVVVRVPESPEAPHATDQGRRVYERTGNQNDPFELAQIDRIRHLLSRRLRLEEQRREFVDREIARAVRQLAESRLDMGKAAGLTQPITETPGPRGVPLRWASVVPTYPWRDLCEAAHCMEVLDDFSSFQSAQRAPGGAFAVRYEATRSRQVKVGCRSITAKGHIFGIECTTETLMYAQTARERKDFPQDHLVDWQNTRQFAVSLFGLAGKFYKSPKVELPGYVTISVGLLGVLGLKMADYHEVGEPFPDEFFGSEQALPIGLFLADTEKAAGPLFQELAFGFDLGRKPRR